MYFYQNILYLFVFIRYFNFCRYNFLQLVVDDNLRTILSTSRKVLRNIHVEILLNALEFLKHSDHVS